ncbi:MAG: CDP-glucose 4,6-dehydratase [Pseudomonadota bacterium]
MPADPGFWAGKRVLLTGHAGFKGGWLAHWLGELGAEVTGLSLAPDQDPALFDIAPPPGGSIIGDLRDPAVARQAIQATAPQIVLHLAAQPLVRRSYRDPAETWSANVMGTVNLLDALREARDLSAILVITSDKVYENDESGHAFAEDARLGGHDPYAASKAATELAVASYRRAFFAEQGVPLATARGGNVIGGGDFSEDRLVPDLVRAARAGAAPVLRNPQATRPWQHVLDCLDGYLAYAQALATRQVPEALNIGPHDPADTQTVADLTRAVANALGLDESWTLDTGPAPHEMAALALDPTRARQALGWQGRLSSAQAIRLTADWYGAWMNGADMTRFTRDQIAAYQAGEPAEAPQ